MSPWTMPWILRPPTSAEKSWQASSIPQSWSAMSTALVLGQRPALEHARQVVPATYSMATQKKSPSGTLLEDRRHLRRDRRELRLERDAVLLGLQHVGIGARRAHHLERHLAAGLGVPGQLDVADRAAAQEVADLEAADVAAPSAPASPRRPRPWRGGARRGRRRRRAWFQRSISAAVGAVAGRQRDLRRAVALDAVSPIAGRAASRTSMPPRGRAGRAGRCRRSGCGAGAARRARRRARPPPGLSWT